MSYAAVTATLAIVTAGTSLAAAWYWLRSSRVKLGQTQASISDDLALHILEAQAAITQSAILSQTAAKWAASAAVLGAATSICGMP